MRNKIPVDLLGITLLTASLLVVLLSSGTDGSPIHVARGLIFTLFAPGYALVASLVPWSNSAATQNSSRQATISFVERLLLSVGLSLVLVPAVGLLVSYSMWGLNPVPLLGSIGLVTLIFTAIATVRRLQLPVSQQFYLPVGETYERVRAWLGGADTRWELVLNVVLLVGLLGVTVGIGAAVVAPGTGETYTELSVQPDSQLENSSLDELPSGVDSDIRIEVVNQEHDTEQYTTVVEFQRFGEGDDRETVVERQEAHRFTQTLEHGESWEETPTVEPTLSGQRVRLAILLYIESPPENPSTENAYRSLYVWVDDPNASETSL